MIINFDPKIKYTCPVCGHYYYESDVINYSAFCDCSLCYTDGYNTRAHSGFIHCPRCGSIFHRQFINEISLSDEEEERITSSEYRDEYFKKTGCHWYGYLDADYFGLPESTEMFSKRWWRSSGSLYFPQSVVATKKREITDLFNVSIWRIAHYRHLCWKRESALTMEKYVETRKNLISRLYYYEPKISLSVRKANRIRLDLLLVKAELMRNLCKFDECLDTVEKIWSKFEKLVYYFGYRTRLDSISEAASNRVSQTLQLPIRRW